MKYKELFYISVFLENPFTRGKMRTVLLLRYWTVTVSMVTLQHVVCSNILQSIKHIFPVFLNLSYFTQLFHEFEIMFLSCIGVITMLWLLYQVHVLNQMLDHKFNEWYLIPKSYVPLFPATLGQVCPCQLREAGPLSLGQPMVLAK